jgi:TetR/AcrR family transcriptional regulator
MNNRENISRQALELFSKKGYDAVGVQEIIDAAGIAKPTLYHYFGSKEGLLKTVLKEYFDKLYPAVETAAVYNGDIKNTLQKITAALVGFAKNNKDFYRMQLSMWFAPAESASNKAVTEQNTKILTLLKMFLSRLQRPREYERQTGAVRCDVSRNYKHSYRNVF